MGFPGGSDGKESTCNAGDPVQSLGWEDLLEAGMATHPTVFTWRIPMDRGAWGRKGDTSDPDWKYAELLRKLSPITYVGENNPPVCLFHGAKDPIVDPADSEKLYHALTEAGADATLICYSYGGHGPSLGEQVDRFAYEFLKDRL